MGTMLMTTMVEDPDPDEQRTPFSASEVALNKARLNYTDVTFLSLTQEKSEELQSIGRACSDCDPKAPSF
jgi:hypothetical protein